MGIVAKQRPIGHHSVVLRRIHSCKDEYKGSKCKRKSFCFQSKIYYLKQCSCIQYSTPAVLGTRGACYASDAGYSMFVLCTRCSKDMWANTARSRCIRAHRYIGATESVASITHFNSFTKIQHEPQHFANFAVQQHAVSSSIGALCQLRKHKLKNFSPCVSSALSNLKITNPQTFPVTEFKQNFPCAKVSCAAQSACGNVSLSKQACECPALGEK